MVVEYGQDVVYLLEFGLDRRLQISVTLVGDMVNRSEDEAFIVLIGHRLLLPDNPDGTNNECHEEGNLPRESFFHIAESGFKNL